MWLWMLIDLCIITKVYGYAGGNFPQSCESMSPKHELQGGQFAAPQQSEPPFEVNYKLGKTGEPITVFLKSKQSKKFRGFMLEARGIGTVNEGKPAGKFIVLESHTTRLLKCNGLADSAVSQRNNQEKTLIPVNWTAQGAELNITFRATFVQIYEIFWERVDVTVTLPPHTTPPPTSTQPSTTTSTTKLSTTSTTKPSTPASTTKPSTPMSTPKPSTTSTTKPSTPTSTPKPSTTTSTTKLSTTSTTQPSTTTCTTKPSTPASTTKPSTPMSTPKPSTPVSTPKPSTTTSTTKSSTTVQGIRSDTKQQRVGTALMHLDSLLVVVKMGLTNILMTAIPNSPSSRHLNKVSMISCSLLCVAVEISALILFCVGDSYKVTFIALVCVVIAINFIELVIISLPMGPSHELKKICDLLVNVCSVIHEIFTIAVIFVGVFETDDCRKNRKESWLLKVMVAYTVWILLFVIWVFIFSTYGKAILGRSKIGSSKNNERGRRQRKKKKLGAAEVIVIVVSAILVVGTMSFSVPVIVGIFGCQEK